MNHRCLFVFVLPALLASSSAFGWGAAGHEFVGAVADNLLNDHAKAQIRDILGFDLKTAATWPDCVRSVKKTDDGTFLFTIDPAHPEYTAPCTAFETPTEQARMEDYASRNWDNCVYAPGRGCHEAYHFADIAEQRGRYADNLTGASTHDVVHAIDAALLVLQGKPAPAPFSIKDKKEAVFLIAHFVGDLHQPLHVGAVYLDATGRLVDPDAGIPPAQVNADLTRGGNSISPAGHEHSPNLHAQWDEIPAALESGPSGADIAAARGAARTDVPLSDFARTWASDTVVLSQHAFSGLTFQGAGPGHWTVTFDDRSSYLSDKADLQHQQLVKGGAHLAELLNDVWP